MLQYKSKYGSSGGIIPSDDKDIFDRLLEIFEINKGHFSTCDEIESKKTKADGFHYELREIAYILEISRTRVQQIEAKALRKLRHPSRSKDLRDFLTT